MRKNPKIELLRSVPGLAGYGDRQLAHLAPLVDEVEMAAGEVLTREGKAGQQAFIILEGEAQVTLDGETLARVGPGDMVGEMALLDHSPRSATVTAVTSLRVLAMDPASFFSLLDQPGVARRVATTLAARLRHHQGAPTYDLESA